jgi:hypothetical protein
MSTPAEQQQALQQAAQFVAEFQNALAPARLQNTHENGVVLEAERQRRKLPMTVESLVKITNDILFEGKLTWLVEPAKLKARQQNTAIQNKNDAAKSQDIFAAKVKAGEAADADAKEKSELVKQCEHLILGYNPTRNTPRGPAYDGRERQDSQAAWTQSLDKAKQQNVQYMREYTTALAAAIQKRYSDREKASERR